MRVRHGWSGEVKPNTWAKFDVELEEDDLRRLLAEAGYPMDVAVGTTENIAFQLLEIQAEIFILAKLMSRHEYPPSEGSEQLAALNAQKERVLARFGEQVPQAAS